MVALFYSLLISILPEAFDLEKIMHTVIALVSWVSKVWWVRKEWYKDI